jgi:hypothetical protein
MTAKLKGWCSNIVYYTPGKDRVPIWYYRSVLHWFYIGLLDPIFFLYNKRRFDNPEFHRNLVLVYQMGKVGSITLQRSLRRFMPEKPVLHTHVINPANYRERIKPYRPMIRRASHPNLAISRQLLKVIRRPDFPSFRWKIVTGVRDPVARDISLFFQQLYRYRPDFIRRYKAGRDTVDKLVDSFGQRFYTAPNPFDWFNIEPKTVFGYDVFAEEFPKTAGFCIGSHRNVEVLTYRLENLNRVAQTAFCRFFGFKSFELKNANVGQQKIYAAIYQAFKQQIELPDAYLDARYNHPFTRHFYTDEEISKFQARWKR